MPRAIQKGERLVIELYEAEKTAMRKAADIVAFIAKFEGGEESAKASSILSSMARNYASPEPVKSE